MVEVQYFGYDRPGVSGIATGASSPFDRRNPPRRHRRHPSASAGPSPRGSRPPALSVVVASRKADAVAEAEAAIRAMGGDALGVVANLSDPDTPASLVASAVERFGRLDIVVNNAANALAQPVGALTTDAWDKSYA